MRCPSCSAAFLDFHGCCALSCSNCPAHFCAWCLAPAADGPANHRHVASCRAKPDGADAYYPGAHWQPFLNERRRRVVRDALARLDPEAELTGEVFDVGRRSQISGCAARGCWTVGRAARRRATLGKRWRSRWMSMTERISTARIQGCFSPFLVSRLVQSVLCAHKKVYG